MINLSEKQIKKIEENKAAAILKKQKCYQKINQPSIFSNPTLSQNNFKETLNNSHSKSQFSKNEFVNSNSPTQGSITAEFSVISEDRFIVHMCYHEPSIEIFKTIPGKMYDSTFKKWTFPLMEHNSVVSKLKSLNSDVTVSPIPDLVIKSIIKPDESDSEQVDWSKIDKTLRNSLMPFQVDGIRFGISKRGRCLIADDMGLGKTIQALGIAHYYKENWPLLIVCPSSIRFHWEEAIRTFLPSVEAKVFVLTNGKMLIPEVDIIISSYDLLKNCCKDLMTKNFKIIILDESHSLKSQKTARTKAALELTKTVKNIILLSGTPALSRPQELYSQIFAIDPFTFRNFFDFGMRYCDGKKDKFGWNFSGASNLKELEIYLRKNIMIRRLKSDVIKQLPSKIRKVIVLHSNIVKSILKQIKKLELEYEKQKGSEKQSTLLSYYNLTARAKLGAVCEYIEEKLENEHKFLIFAHHVVMLDSICELLNKKKVEYIRIDGSVCSELRKVYCDKFQSEDKCRIAVLSIKAANCGITLTAAQLVIFAELYWNPGELTQAEDRVHRIGQQDSVLIEYLIAKGTADEHLWNLIQSKLNVLNRVGLSKDSFQNADAKNFSDSTQPTITSMLQKVSKSDDCTANSETFNVEMDDDDIFSNINLEEIENEYLINSKKRKTNETV